MNWYGGNCRVGGTVGEFMEYWNSRMGDCGIGIAEWVGL